MTYQEFEVLTINTLGEEALRIMIRFFAGRITLEECLKDICETTPPENIEKFEHMMQIVKTEIHEVI